ncbi:MAG: hypothetical protein LH619_05390, partial [Chitinophagaceae bacterium]|nr:hypothetical protein [Chitinophagaceae bacterium]
MVSLSEIYLYGTLLTSIPESISKLSNLTEIGLGGNLLTSLPESMSGLINLK